MLVGVLLALIGKCEPGATSTRRNALDDDRVRARSSQSPTNPTPSPTIAAATTAPPHPTDTIRSLNEARIITNLPVTIFTTENK